MNPVLVELTRGRLVESRHRGAIAVSDAAGRVVAALGDVGRPVFPRSAVKSMQAVPLIESGAADALGFAEAELALAAASHVGSAEHVAVAAGMLAATGLGEAALECGAHQPLAAAAAREMIAAGEKATALHNNCSGKHAGMLATAVHLGEPTAGYVLPDHPVQVRARQVMEDLTGLQLGPDCLGIDGCSVPNFALPSTALAAAFAAFVTGTGRGATHSEAAERIMAACWARPDLVGGTGRLDTLVMERLPQKVFMKTGAEGVYCAGLPGLGLGIALKIDDGAKRAAEAVVMEVLARLVPEAAALRPRHVELNWRGIETGGLQLSDALAAWLDRLPAG